MVRKFTTFYVGIVSLLVVTSFPGFTQEADSAISPPPGLYNKPIILQASDHTDELLLQFLPESGGTGIPLQLREPLPLTSLPGERREYIFTVIRYRDGTFTESGPLTYIIDMERPRIPVFSQPPGIYNSAQRIQLSGSNATDTYWYRINNSEPKVYDEFIPLAGSPGERRQFTMEVWAVDEAENKSPVQTGRFIIDRTAERGEPSLQILSPVPGTFINPQALYIKASGMNSIRYTVNGTDPKVFGEVYQGITTVSGDVSLRVWSIDGNGKEYHANVELTTGTTPYGEIAQGFTGNSLEIPVLYSDMTYVAEERSPGIFDLPFNRPLRIRPQDGSLRALTLRIHKPDRGEYRLFFLLDGFPPPDFTAQVLRRDSGYNPVYRNIDTHDPVYTSDILVGSGHDQHRLQIATESSEGPWRTVKNLLVSELTFSRENTIWLRTQNPAGKTSPVQSYSVVQPSNLEQPIESLVEVEDNIIRFNPPAEGILVSINDHHPVLLEEAVEVSLPRELSETMKFAFFTPSSGSLPPQKIGSSTIQFYAPVPRGPEIEIRDDTLVVKPGDADSKLQYRINASDPQAPSIQPQFIEYLQPVELEGRDGVNLVYWIEAREQLGEDDWSIPTSREHVIHMVPPKKPVLTGLLDDQIFTQEQITLPLGFIEKAVKYNYALLNIDTEDLETGTFEDGELQLSFGLEESRYTLELWAESQYDPSLESERMRYSFSVDTVVPLAPTIFTDPENEVTGNSVTLSVTHDNGETALVYLTINGSEPSIYTSPLTLRGSPGLVHDFEILAFTQDVAGNQSQPVKKVVTIDREPPGIPRVLVVDENESKFSQNGRIVTAKPVDIILEGEGTLYYQLSTNGSLPAIPSFDSPQYTGSIRLTGERGNVIEYRMLARGKDDVGNWGAVTEMVTVIIDQQIPEPPPEPVVVRDGNSGLISWDDFHDTIQYRFSNQMDFQLYTRPISWTIEPGVDTLRFFYRSIDEAGNLSDVSTLQIDEKNTAPRPIVLLEDQDKISTTVPEITLQPTIENATIRYELYFSDSPVPDVTNRSPVWDGSLDLNHTPGETLEYRIVFRQFAPGIEPSEPVYESFIIDTTPPLPPETEDEQFRYIFYNEGTLLLSTQAPTDTIFLKITKKAFEPHEIPGFTVPTSIGSVQPLANYTEHNGRIRLPGEAGFVTLYQVEAVAQDEAGNISSRSRRFEVIVDRASIYLSNHNDLRNPRAPIGTRENPARSITEAKELLYQKNRNRLYLTEGTYLLGEGIENISGLIIRGGLDRNWQPSTNETVLALDANFPDETVFDFTAGNTTYLHNLFITDQRGVTEQLLRVNPGASIVLDTLSLVVTGKTQVLSAYSASNTLVERTHIIANESTVRQLIHSDNASELSLNEILIEYTRTPAFLRNNRNENTGSALTRYSLHSLNTKLAISNSEIHGPSGSLTSVIFAKDSDLTISNSSIFVGQANDLGIGVHSIGGAFTAKNSIFYGDLMTPSTALVRLEEGVFDSQSNSWHPSGQRSASGMITRLSEITSVGDTIVANSAEDFITVFNFQNSSAVIEDLTSIEAWNTAELILNTIDRSRVHWINGDLDLTNTGSTLGFQIQNARDVVVENMIMGAGGNSLVFYLADTDTKLNVRNNIFEGWNTLLLQNEPGWRTSLDAQTRIIDIPALEAGSIEGQIFSGNQIRQGL